MTNEPSMLTRRIAAICFAVSVVVLVYFYEDEKEVRFWNSELALAKGQFVRVGHSGSSNYGSGYVVVTYAIDSVDYQSSGSISSGFERELKKYDKESLFFNVLYVVDDPAHAKVKVVLRDVFIKDNLLLIDTLLYK